MQRTLSELVGACGQCATKSNNLDANSWDLILLMNNSLFDPHDLVQGFLLFPIFEQKSENVKKLIFWRPWKHQK